MDIYDPLHLSPLEKLIWTLEAWEDEIDSLPSEELDRILDEEEMGIDVETLLRSIESLKREYIEEQSTTSCVEAQEGATEPDTHGSDLAQPPDERSAWTLEGGRREGEDTRAREATRKSRRDGDIAPRIAERSMDDVSLPRHFPR